MSTRYQISPLGVAIRDLGVGEGLNVRNRTVKSVYNIAAHLRARHFPERRFKVRCQNDGSVNIYRVSDAREAAR